MISPGYAFGTLGDAGVAGCSVSAERPEQPANAAVAIRAPTSTPVRSLEKVDVTGRILPASFRAAQPGDVRRPAIRARISFACRNFRRVDGDRPDPPRTGCRHGDRPN